MAWYWYWLMFLGAAGGSYYLLFYYYPAYRNRTASKNTKEDIEEEFVIDDDPIKNCPICSNEMTKDSLNGIIVDRCTLHGIWFDRGELKSVVDFVKSGGNIDSFFATVEVEK